MWGGAGAGLEGGWRGRYHVKFPCYIRHLYGINIDKCLILSVRVYFRNKILANIYLFSHMSLVLDLVKGWVQGNLNVVSI